MIFEWKKPLGNKNKPYAYRWRLDFYWFSFRVHKWICPDDTRAWHNHPTNMLIFILSGGYKERNLCKNPLTDNMLSIRRVYRAGMLRWIPRDYKHYIEEVDNPTWTLIFTYGAPKRWAFWDRASMKKLNRDKYFLKNGHHICD